MKIRSIKIENLAGFPTFESTLGSVCLLEGPHGAGKSSIEQVVMYALGRRPLADKGSRSIPHDPGILHGNAERGEALICFDEGSDAEFLRVVVKPDKTTREIKMAGKKRWEDAGRFIDDITSALAYNPLAFKDLSPKERVEALLRVAPVDLKREELDGAVGGVVPVPAGPVGLETLNQLYDDIYAARTTENVAADTQAKHAQELENALPPVAPGQDWDADVKQLRAEMGRMEEGESAGLLRIGKDLQVAKDKAAVDRRAREQVVDKEFSGKIADIDRRIRELQVDRETICGEKRMALQAVATEEESTAASSRDAANEAARALRESNIPPRDKLRAAIATAEERARAAAQAEGTRAAAKQAREQAEARRAKSSAMTTALVRLTSLKDEVAGRMSVKGVTIASPRDGMPVDICRIENDALVPFSRWNDFSKDQFSLRMAVMFRGQCGLVMIDNLANFSPARREALLDTARKYAVSDGMQFIIGMATDEIGGLKIKDAGA